MHQSIIMAKKLNVGFPITGAKFEQPTVRIVFCFLGLIVSEPPMYPELLHLLLREEPLMIWGGAGKSGKKKLNGYSLRKVKKKTQREFSARGPPRSLMVRPLYLNSHLNTLITCKTGQQNIQKGSRSVLGIFEI